GARHSSWPIRMRHTVKTALALLSVLAVAGTAVAQDVTSSTAIPPPRDVPYSGTIRLDVDATDVVRHLYRVHETIPVAPGALTLLYPRWLPGNHSPTGRIEQLTGLAIRNGARRIEWVRDRVDVYAFHVNISAGVTALDADFQVATATDGDQGRMVMTPEMLNLQWDAVLLYPAGFYARRITFEPSLKLPIDWQFGTALERASQASFKPVALDTLIDSPLFAGRNFKREQLSDTPVPVWLNIV